MHSYLLEKHGMKAGQSIRCKQDHGLRIAFLPEFSPSRPFATYQYGTAGRRFADLPNALDWLGPRNRRMWTEAA